MYTHLFGSLCYSQYPSVVLSAYHKSDYHTVVVPHQIWVGLVSNCWVYCWLGVLHSDMAEMLFQGNKSEDKIGKHY